MPRPVLLIRILLLATVPGQVHKVKPGAGAPSRSGTINWVIGMPPHSLRDIGRSIKLLQEEGPSLVPAKA